MEQTSYEQEVYFHEYCKTCKHENVSEADEPCEECLENATNTESHKPVRWEAK